ncbi:MAG TPA: hypothetical protein VE709_03185 [Pseudonocardiaceae bacterium]|nr:hypothetical protein [Pseudonocardiaceae bacterium]
MHTRAVYAELTWQGRTAVVTVGGVAVAAVRRVLLRERAEVDIGGAPRVLGTHAVRSPRPTRPGRCVARGEARHCDVRAGRTAARPTRRRSRPRSGSRLVQSRHHMDIWTELVEHLASLRSSR